MVDFYPSVNPPTGVSYAPPLLNFSPLADLGSKFFQGAQDRSQYDASQILKNGVPMTPDGQPDYAKAAQMLAQSGNLPAVAEMAKIGAVTQKTLPPGYRRSANGGYEAIPGGPADPAVISATAAAGQKPQFTQIGEDALGQKQYGFVDPITHKVTPAATAPGAGSPGAVGSSSQLFNSIAEAQARGASQDELYNLVPVELRAGVKALIEGKQVPTNVSQRSPARTAALLLAHTIDPNFDETIIPQRTAFAKSMGSLQPSTFGGQVKASGTVMKHLGDAYDELPVIEGGGALAPGEMLSGLNPLKAKIRGQMGDQQYNDAMGHYKSAITGIAGELDLLLTGGVGTEHSKQAWIDKLDITQHPPSEVRAALDEVRSLMMGRLSNVAEQKDRAYGTTTDPLSLLGPKEQAIAKAITSGTYKSQKAARPAAPNAAPSSNAAPKYKEGDSATNPKTGEALIFRNGNWEPLS
jgi:hypothetical protein